MKTALLVLTLVGLGGCSVPVNPQGDAALAETAQKPRDSSKDAAAISKLHPNVVAVDSQAFATPPRLVITLKGAGWSESDILYGFASDAAAVLNKMAKKKLIPSDQGITYILRVESESGGQTQERNVLHVALDQQVVKSVAGGGDISAQALLDSAAAEFNGRMGRDIAEKFCSDDKYQGAGGVLRTVEFCGYALGDQDSSSS
ncbi:hypothetical protein GIW57_04990 [Stenotrophomonas sp. PA-6-5C]|uniref:hypothetical protein n=1 Tax=Stenotrophomonas TaxID=40323 RepID=UPI001F4556F4|nr:MULTISPECIES: hypothetical protein [Stenotrophomonas]MCF5089531.1 hypothetical protein [Stenotrophomonas sp. PA-6-5C]